MQALTKIPYPVTRRGEQVDDYHGTLVSDPYRWLENMDSSETRAWVESQAAITRPHLEALPHRRWIKDRLTQLWNYEKRGIPWKMGRRYFWYHNTGLQNQSVLFVGNSADGKNARVLLDPNTLASDGTVALSAVSISPDGKLLAYATAASGSDWQEWHVRDIRTGKDLVDHLCWCKFSGASWMRDSSGFFYSRYDQPNEIGQHEDSNKNHKVFYHRLSQPQSADELVYARPDHPGWLFSASVTEDGNYLIIDASEGFDSNQVFFKDLTEKDSSFIELLNKNDAHYYFLDNDGPLFWFQTDLNASRGRIVSVDVSKLEAAGGAPLTEVIPQAAETLQSAGLLDNKFVVTYLKDAHTQVRIFTLKGKHVRDVEFPGLGTVSGFYGMRRQYLTYYTFTSFNTPDSSYRYNMRSGKSELFYQPRIGFNPEEYVTEQVFYASKDGTRVPMFICYRKGLSKQGDNPTYLYGYGGFGVNEVPFFSASILVWMEMGGIFAMPNLRGGGEYGESWHQAGVKLKKQNVFDDFIAAAEWLIANGYTATPKLSIGGGSNGGLLVGACMTQRPDLYAAAFPAVGVLDMLRFHKFTVGSHWVSEYGSSENAEEFQALYAYSPVHNVRAGTSFPSTLVTTADHDDRVVPAHSFKFISALQSAHAGETPVLIRIEQKAGHGAGKPTTKIIEEAADKWAFALSALNFEPPAAAFPSSPSQR